MLYSKKSSSPNIFSGGTLTTINPKQPVPRPSSSNSSRGGVSNTQGGSSTTNKDSIDSSRKSSEESANVTSQVNNPTRFGRFNMFARKTTKKKSKDSSIKETKLKLFLKRTSEPLLDSFSFTNQKKVREGSTNFACLLLLIDTHSQSSLDHLVLFRGISFYFNCITEVSLKEFREGTLFS